MGGDLMAATKNVLTVEQIEEIIERVASGLTLLQSCKKAKKDYMNVNKRINADSELKRLHAYAREEHMRVRVQSAHDIAADPNIDPARARIMIDLIKWEVARVLPKEFGDRVQQEVIITHNTTLSQRMQAARTRAAVKAVATDLPPTTEEES